MASILLAGPGEIGATSLDSLETVHFGAPFFFVP